MTFSALPRATVLCSKPCTNDNAASQRQQRRSPSCVVSIQDYSRRTLSCGNACLVTEPSMHEEGQSAGSRREKLRAGWRMCEHYKLKSLRAQQLCSKPSRVYGGERRKWRGPNKQVARNTSLRSMCRGHHWSTQQAAKAMKKATLVWWQTKFRNRVRRHCDRPWRWRAWPQQGQGVRPSWTSWQRRRHTRGWLLLRSHGYGHWVLAQMRTERTRQLR
mmetsp:Transcript_16779/g.38855  ORF Transcript_16779/g.38855 Transcript_16779/m.38855 type:complete len:217 (+) Transcript_16779:219-869(+)